MQFSGIYFHSLFSTLPLCTTSLDVEKYWHSFVHICKTSWRRIPACQGGELRKYTGDADMELNLFSNKTRASAKALHKSVRQS